MQRKKVAVHFRMEWVTFSIAIIALVISFFSFKQSKAAFSVTSTSARCDPIRATVNEVYLCACDAISFQGEKSKEASRNAVRLCIKIDVALEDFLEKGCVLTDQELGQSLVNFRMLAGSEDLIHVIPSTKKAAEFELKMKNLRMDLMSRVRNIAKSLPDDII